MKLHPKDQEELDAFARDTEFFKKAVVVVIVALCVFIGILVFG